MMSRWCALLLGMTALSCPLLTAVEPSPPATVPPSTVIVLDDANRLLKVDLDRRYQDLVQRFASWKQRAEAFNRIYAEREITQGSPEAVAGAAEQAKLIEELAAYQRARERFASDLRGLRIDRVRRIACLNALAAESPWGDQERNRLDVALNRLAHDGDDTVTIATIAATWATIAARGHDADMARSAAAGDGPGFPSAGTQSFNDCTLFALATASGQPYGVVAARATKLLEDATWRADADRAAPQRVIERHGLDGYEVIMLAEALGEAEVVPSTAFAATLQTGCQILACVVTVDESGDDALHQILLTKTFRRGNETWYEIVDSNLGALERRYLSARELDIVLQENGVAYRPEPRTVPTPLRIRDAP